MVYGYRGEGRMGFPRFESSTEGFEFESDSPRRTLPFVKRGTLVLAALKSL